MVLVGARLRIVDESARPRASSAINSFSDSAVWSAFSFDAFVFVNPFQHGTCGTAIPSALKRGAFLSRGTA